MKSVYLMNLNRISVSVLTSRVQTFSWFQTDGRGSSTTGGTMIVPNAKTCVAGVLFYAGTTGSASSEAPSPATAIWDTARNKATDVFGVLAAATVEITQLEVLGQPEATYSPGAAKGGTGSMVFTRDAGNWTAEFTSDVSAVRATKASATIRDAIRSTMSVRWDGASIRETAHNPFQLKFLWQRCHEEHLSLQCIRVNSELWQLHFALPQLIRLSRAFPVVDDFVWFFSWLLWDSIFKLKDLHFQWLRLKKLKYLQQCWHCIPKLIR